MIIFELETLNTSPAYCVILSATWLVSKQITTWIHLVSEHETQAHVIITLMIISLIIQYSLITYEFLIHWPFFLLSFSFGRISGRSTRIVPAQPANIIQGIFKNRKARSKATKLVLFFFCLMLGLAIFAYCEKKVL